MLLTLDDMIELKHAMQTQCGVTVHVHDACGGQSFTLERIDPAIEAALRAFLAKKGQAPQFLRGTTDFIITEAPSC